jgi:hypothetical protein
MPLMKFIIVYFCPCDEKSSRGGRDRGQTQTIVHLKLYKKKTTLTPLAYYAQGADLF